MWNNKLVVGICPAREGSKGIKHKNIKKIAGKTLIAISGEFITSSNIIDIGVITSDSELFLEEGIKNGFHNAIKRPDFLSTDEASSLDTWIHAWQLTEDLTGKIYPYGVLLQPTSPLRTEDELTNSFQLMHEKNYDAVTTVSEVPGNYKPEKIICKNNGNLDFFIQEKGERNNRNLLKDYWYRNGNFYIATRQQILEKKCLLEGNYGFYPSKNYTVNIDEEADLKLARLIMEEK